MYMAMEYYARIETSVGLLILISVAVGLIL